MLEKLRHTIGRIVYEDSTSSHEEVGEVSRNLIPTTDNEIKRPTLESMLGTGGRSMTKGFVNFADSKAVINLCLMFILTYVLLATVAFSFIFERWSIIDSAYYATVTFTTIGYGDVSPSTTPGKIFAILFVLVGVAIVGVALGIVGEMALVHQEQAISKLQARGKRRVITMIKGTSGSMPSVSAGRGVGSPFVESSSATAMGDKHESKFLKGSLKIIQEDGWLLFIVLLLAIAIGYFENWSFIDSLYYAVISMTTVGYGDLHPDLQLTRLFAVVFLPFAVVLLAKVLGGITGLWMEGRADEAEQEFLRRELTLADLTTIDTNSDGRVSFSEFLSFMLLAMQKIEKEDLHDLQQLFKQLDANSNGTLDKNDLIMLAERKKQAMSQSEAMSNSLTPVCLC